MDGEWDMGWREGMWGRKGWDVGVGYGVGVRGWDVGVGCGGEVRGWGAGLGYGLSVAP